MSHTPDAPTSPSSLTSLPTAESVVAAHPPLPGLAALVDRDRLAELFTPLVGEKRAARARVQRLRIKPGTSVTAAVCVDSMMTFLPATDSSGRLEPARSWWRVRVLSEESWEEKGAKEVRRAERHGLPSLAVPQLRTIVVSAEADRVLPHLHRLRPDTGSLVRMPEVTGMDPLTSLVWTRTLSYNPDRRWVGVVHDVEGRPLELLRWMADEERPVCLPWTPGGAWTFADHATLAAELAEVVRGSLAACTDLEPRELRLREVADFLTHVHRPWGERAHTLLDRVMPALAPLPLDPAHGDLTSDQAVVHDGHVAVLDWDRAGLYPRGWDRATWQTGQLLDAHARGADTAAVPDAHADPTGQNRPPIPAATLAAAFLNYTPDPFRRQMDRWAELTERMLTAAEKAAETLEQQR